MCPIGARYRESLSDDSGGQLVLGKLNSFHGRGNPYGPSYYGKTNWVEPQTILSGSNVPYSSINRWSWDQVNPGPPFETGGALCLIKTVIPSQIIQGTGVYEGDHNGASYIQYSGGWSVPDFFGDTLATADYSSVSAIKSSETLFPDLGTLGSGAYSRLRPKLAEAQVGVAIGELRDLPHMLSETGKEFHNAWKDLAGPAWRRTDWKMAPKNIGNSFLNVQFGWSPFIKDIGDLIRIAGNLEGYMAQVKRDNNQWVKRHRVDKKIESEELIPLVQPVRCQPTLGWPLSEIFDPNSSTYAYLTLRSETSVWYEGVFKYYRPEFDDTNSRSRGLLGLVDRNLTLYGARINPSTLWKVTPWTWLADWFGNVGQAIERANDWAMDGVVSKYMYLMHSTAHRCTLNQVLGLRSGRQLLSWERNATVKRRESASSPFDFNLKDTDLSARQLAILGAIGLTGARPRGNRPG